MTLRDLKKAQKEAHKAFDNWTLIEASDTPCTGGDACPRCAAHLLLQVRTRIAIDVAHAFLMEEGPLPKLDATLKKQVARALKVKA